jgi:hypothetical protein
MPAEALRLAQAAEQRVSSLENRMAGFLFRLELEDGTSADPPTFETAVHTWATWRHDPARSQRTSRGWYSR